MKNAPLNDNAGNPIRTWNIQSTKDRASKEVNSTIKWLRW